MWKASLNEQPVNTRTPYDLISVLCILPMPYSTSFSLYLNPDKKKLCIILGKAENLKSGIFTLVCEKPAEMRDLLIQGFL